MNFSADVYKQADAELDRRRQQAEKKREKYLVELHAAHPTLKEIDDNIAKVGSKALKSLQKNLGNGKVATKALSQIEMLEDERKAYLKETKTEEITNFFTCKICSDTGRLDGKYCTCRDIIAMGIASNISGLSGEDLPTFDDFDLSLYDDTRLLRGKSYRKYAELALDRAKNFTKGHLIIQGGTGLGKTFTAECIVSQFSARGKAVFYMSSPRLFSMLEEQKFGVDKTQDTKDRIKLMHDCDLTVIDDLGTEHRTSTGLVDSYLFELLEHRLKHKKATVITTNLAPQDIKATYSERIYSRLVGEFKWLSLFGDDIRLK